MDRETLPWDQAGTDGHGDTVRALLHDLRGPVAAIRNLANSPAGQTDRGLQAIIAHAGWLGCLIENALSEGAHDDVRVVDVGSSVERAVTMARHRGGAAVGIATGPPTRAWARPVALGRALDCILDNATRAAGPDGQVVVRTGVDVRTGEVSVVIADDGPGLGRIASGTALGLTTTRAMVAACGGAFELAAGCDGGAVATIHLELAAEERVAG